MFSKHHTLQEATLFKMRSRHVDQSEDNVSGKESFILVKF